MDIEQLAGTKLGNYKIESLLGRGGMGVVYKARQINLDRPVALKILPPNLSSDSSYVKRFEREAHAIAALNHPNIVQIYDVGHEGQTYYYTMEFVDGVSLDNILYQKTVVSLDRAIKIIFRMAEALAYTHRKGIIHRDVKPSNIMIDRLGGMKLTDFGLALQDRAERVTVAGGIVGTPEYMSPEQASGETATALSDIYSLGVVFYELLTGRVPFEADTPLGVIKKIQAEEPSPPRSINSNIPPGVERIILKMMAKDPGRRYQSCRALVSDLRRFRRGEPITPLFPFILSNRRSVRVAAAIMLSVALAGGTTAYFLSRSGKKAGINIQDARHLESQIAKLQTHVDSFDSRLDVLHEKVESMARSANEEDEDILELRSVMEEIAAEKGKLKQLIGELSTSAHESGPATASPGKRASRPWVADAGTVFESGIYYPTGMTFTKDGSLLVLSGGHGDIYKIEFLDGRKNGVALFSKNPRVRGPQNIAVDRNGLIYISTARIAPVSPSPNAVDEFFSELFRINPATKKTTLIKRGSSEVMGMTTNQKEELVLCRALPRYIDDKHEAAISRFRFGWLTGYPYQKSIVENAEPRPVDLAFDSDNNLFYVSGNAVTKISRGFFGRKTEQFANLATDQFRSMSPTDIEIDGNDNLYIGMARSNGFSMAMADLRSSSEGVVLKVNPDGNAATFATGLASNGDIVTDAEGWIYVSDPKGNAIFRFPAD